MDHINSLYSPQSRTAGLNPNATKSVQAWKTPKPATITETADTKTQQNDIIASLEKAADGRVGHFDYDLNAAQAYADSSIPNNPQARTQKEGFEFGDVINTINPLHHIPVVGTAYRGLTGSTLHPISQIIGGALYGGPIGAITGTANAITQVQTGKDMGNHALGFLGLNTPNSNSVIEAQLTQTANAMERGNFNQAPNMALGFAGSGEVGRAIQSYEKGAMAQGRTAGTMMQPVALSNTSSKPAPSATPDINLNSLPKIEVMTTLSLSPMPQVRDI